MVGLYGSNTESTHYLKEIVVLLTTGKLSKLEKTPFISIAIPTRKNPDYVRRLLDSVAIQTFKDFEVLISDGSPNNTTEMLVEDYRNRINIRYQRNMSPENMGGNFNKSLRMARGRWIKMMHDDDWFSSPEALAKFANIAQHSDSKFIFCASLDVYGKSVRVKEQSLSVQERNSLEQDPFFLLSKNVIGHPSAVMHINDPELEYDPKFNWLIDIDFYIRFLRKYPSFEFIPDFLVNIGIDENQMSAVNYKNPRVEIPEYLNLLSKYPLELASENESVFHMLWDLVRKFKLRDLEPIRTAGYSGLVPEKEIKFIINYQKTIPNIVLKQPPWSRKLMKGCFNSFRRSGRLV